MGAMLNIDRPAIKIGCSILASSLLLAVFHLIYLDRFYYSCELEIEFVADQPDTLVIFFPDKESKYYGRQSTQIRYTSGGQNIKVTIPLHHADKPLVLDPGFKANGLTIQKLSFTRFGVVESLNPKQIEKCIVKTNDVVLTQIEEGVRLEFSVGNPMIFLRGFPIPGLGWLKSCVFLLGLVISSLVFSLFLYRLFQNKSTEHQLGLLPVILILLVTGSKFSWPYPVLLLLFFLFSYSLIKNIITFSKHELNGLYTVSLRQISIITCFLFLLTWPLYRIISPEAVYISGINNSISDFLSVSDEKNIQNRTRSLFDTIENNFLSHFPFSKNLLNFNAYIKIFRLGFSPTDKSILGKNGMFFEGYGERRIEADITGSFDNITDYMGLSPFTEDELEKWLICLEERYYWLKQQGIDYIFVLAPTKALVYPENLPARILNIKSKLNKPTRYEQLVSYLKDKSLVPIVDLRKHLIAAKHQLKDKGLSDDLLLYYRTDFHWNYLGSFFAYQAIIDEINRFYPQYQLDVSQLDEFTIHRQTDWVHGPFIYQLGLNPVKHKNETYITFFPNPESIYSGIGDFGGKGINDSTCPPHLIKEFGGIDTKFRLLENQKGEVSSIFVIGDSFSEKYLGFFSKHAKKTTNFRTVNSFLPEIYIDNSPDLVIQEILNMYLLKPPPVNPASIQRARVNALAENKATVSASSRK